MVTIIMITLIPKGYWTCVQVEKIEHCSNILMLMLYTADIFVLHPQEAAQNKHS